MLSSYNKNLITQAKQNYKIKLNSDNRDKISSYTKSFLFNNCNTKTTKLINYKQFSTSYRSDNNNNGSNNLSNSSKKKQKKESNSEIKRMLMSNNINQSLKEGMYSLMDEVIFNNSKNKKGIKNNIKYGNNCNEKYGNNNCGVVSRNVINGFNGNFNNKNSVTFNVESGNKHSIVYTEPNINLCKKKLNIDLTDKFNLASQISTSPNIPSSNQIDTTLQKPKKKSVLTMDKATSLNQPSKNQKNINLTESINTIIKEKIQKNNGLSNPFKYQKILCERKLDTFTDFKKNFKNYNNINLNEKKIIIEKNNDYEKYFGRINSNSNSKKKKWKKIYNVGNNANIGNKDGDRRNINKNVNSNDNFSDNNSFNSKIEKDDFYNVNSLNKSGKKEDSIKSKFDKKIMETKASLFSIGYKK